MIWERNQLSKAPAFVVSGGSGKGVRSAIEVASPDASLRRALCRVVRRGLREAQDQAAERLGDVPSTDDYVAFRPEIAGQTIEDKAWELVFLFHKPAPFLDGKRSRGGVNGNPGGGASRNISGRSPYKGRGKAHAC